MFFGIGQVGGNHLLHQFIGGYFWHPVEFLFGLSGIAEQTFNL